MTGVVSEREAHPAPVGRDVIGRVAEVVLHVVVPLRIGRRELRLELAEDRLQRFLHDVGEEVDAAAVRHADRELLDPHGGCARHQRLEHGDQRGGALQREALLAGVARMEELLEAVGCEHGAQQPEPGRVGELRPVARGLHARLEPLALARIGDVHELGAERAAVGLAQRVHELAQRALELAVERGLDLAIQVRFREPERRQLEEGMRRHWGHLERVQVCDQVAELAVGVHQRVGAVGATAGGGLALAEFHPGKEQRPILGH